MLWVFQALVSTFSVCSRVLEDGVGKEKLLNSCSHFPEAVQLKTSVSCVSCAVVDVAFQAMFRQIEVYVGHISIGPVPAIYNFHLIEHIHIQDSMESWMRSSVPIQDCFIQLSEGEGLTLKMMKSVPNLSVLSRKNPMQLNRNLSCKKNNLIVSAACMLHMELWQELSSVFRLSHCLQKVYRCDKHEPMLAMSRRPFLVSGQIVFWPNCKAPFDPLRDVSKGTQHRNVLSVKGRKMIEQRPCGQLGFPQVYPHRMWWEENMMCPV